MNQYIIMIVEDEVVVGMDLTEKLERLGYQVAPTVIRYGEDVLEAAQKVMPDLILMDIKLKGEMNGTQAALSIQESLGLPVIFLTAFSDGETLSNAKKSEPYAFLKKPVRLEDLKIALEIGIYKAQMEQKLKEKELLFRTVADFTFDWETWVGPKGNYIYTSPSCKRITGYSREEFVKDPKYLYKIVHPSEKEKVKKTIEHHLNFDKTSYALEFRILQSDGEERWIEHISQPVYAPSGRYIGQRASNRDISHRKELEFMLQKKVIELQEALMNIKTLTGLIPICAGCKKIRDDKGFWNQVDAYIEKHSGAKFSHAMCPSCMESYYGDEEWYQEMKDEEK